MAVIDRWRGLGFGGEKKPKEEAFSSVASAGFGHFGGVPSGRSESHECDVAPLKVSRAERRTRDR